MLHTRFQPLSLEDRQSLRSLFRDPAYLLLLRYLYSQVALKQAEYANAATYRASEELSNRAIMALVEAKQHVDAIRILEQITEVADKDLTVATFSPYPGEPLT